MAFLETDLEIALWYMCSPDDYEPRVIHIVFNKWFNVFSEDFKDYSRSNQIFTGYDEESEVFYISLIYNHTIFDKERIEQEIDLAKTSIENLKS
ncbi:MAG TPA: hypothetical protein ENH91_09225 [Leeuwenhoekiella sp.]|nr:hypothetical protein [Leeuwenhoekiella sp.]